MNTKLELDFDYSIVTVVVSVLEYLMPLGALSNNAIPKRSKASGLFLDDPMTSMLRLYSDMNKHIISSEPLAAKSSQFVFSSVKMRTPWSLVVPPIKSSVRLPCWLVLYATVA